MRTRAAVRWWVGWNPVATVGAGAFVGAVVGNVLLTWSVRAAMLGGGVSRFVGAPLQAAVGDGGGYLAALAVLPAFLAIGTGALAGGLLWTLGVRTVNAGADDVVDRALRGTLGSRADASGDVAGRATADLEGGVPDGEQFVLSSGHGTLPLVGPSRRHDISRIRCAADRLVVSVERLRLDDRRVDRVGGVSIPYEAIESVDYDGTSLVVDEDDGRYAFAADRDPVELREAIRSRRESAAGADSSGR